MKPTAVAQLTFRAREGLREAWIQAHLRSVADGSDCQWTIEHLGAYSRANISRRDRVKVEAHLAGCARCAIVASEAKEVSGRLALVLLPLTVGAGRRGRLPRVAPGRRAPRSSARRDALGGHPGCGHGAAGGPRRRSGRAAPARAGPPERARPPASGRSGLRGRRRRVAGRERRGSAAAGAAAAGLPCRGRGSPEPSRRGGFRRCRSGRAPRRPAAASSSGIGAMARPAPPRASIVAGTVVAGCGRASRRFAPTSNLVEDDRHRHRPGRPPRPSAPQSDGSAADAPPVTGGRGASRPRRRSSMPTQPTTDGRRRRTAPPQPIDAGSRGRRRRRAAADRRQPRRRRPARRAGSRAQRRRRTTDRPAADAGATRRPRPPSRARAAEAGPGTPSANDAKDLPDGSPAFAGSTVGLSSSGTRPGRHRGASSAVRPARPRSCASAATVRATGRDRRRRDHRRCSCSRPRRRSAPTRGSSCAYVQRPARRPAGRRPHLGPALTVGPPATRGRLRPRRRLEAMSDSPRPARPAAARPRHAGAAVGHRPPRLRVRALRLRHPRDLGLRDVAVPLEHRRRHRRPRPRDRGLGAVRLASRRARRAPVRPRDRRAARLRRRRRSPGGAWDSRGSASSSESSP